MYKISFYVPKSYAETVKEAMFKAGAGKIGHYSRCAWQVSGEGQFMPLEGSQAFIGEKNKLEKVAEYKVEMICAEEYILDVVSALKKAHPYETPAYYITRCEVF
ncbi:hypothetical protein [Legionella israelensis]|uniref:Structural toxin protein (Hemagglutinin/hemolysin) RtxA n=1 Tax=Legionella israelensis TaxID=454 RepID=A0A0W0V2S9_9GAMM|nr:hypothetical protein [Legionella israelensis]KTD14404.1 structural toxin protein (hemagglutinin/hemolysin) RtxA [Legionella israelensis]QBS10174.1 NGG1p interacting factor NIF3 [Legionella israelensis]SCY35148.1 structural toxin protein (hemagglutinin/hemolysin) RtxA [Legionella israelensis DSM 19235]STX59765.1 structural toxin protein (hemagglutinin/hemolysin) RtxA [Legionella israelensis]